ncbi:hypothetical protein [Streptomyces sp. KL116D]|uniref:hypothetical protein n=1 Tax=Streptomyces sp. KL116D TaxID=3045152 RepID=UPI00355741D1
MMTLLGPRPLSRSRSGAMNAAPTARAARPVRVGLHRHPRTGPLRLLERAEDPVDVAPGRAVDVAVVHGGAGLRRRDSAISVDPSMGGGRVHLDQFADVGERRYTGLGRQACDSQELGEGSVPGA